MVEDIIPVNCEERGIDGKWKDKLIIFDQETILLDTFKDPKKFYIINAWNDHVYFKTIKRSKAQEMADEIYGKGFYTVKTVVKAQVR